RLEARELLRPAAVAAARRGGGARAEARRADDRELVARPDRAVEDRVARAPLGRGHREAALLEQAAHARRGLALRAFALLPREVELRARHAHLGAAASHLELDDLAAAQRLEDLL